MDWINDVTYFLMPSRHPVKGYEKEYYAAYDVWKAAWQKFYDESGITEPLTADGFIIPDEMGVIFYKGECVGLASFTHGSLDIGTMKDHSWFQCWTPEALEKLRNISTECIICSQFTISPKFTGKNQIVRWKEILFLFNHLRFNNSNAGVMAGHLNLSRGMNNAGGADYGGTLLEGNHQFTYHGIHQYSQLVAYERSVIYQMIDRKNIEQMCDALWSRLVNLSEFPVQAPILTFTKKAA